MRHKRQAEDMSQDEGGPIPETPGSQHMSAQRCMISRTLLSVRRNLPVHGPGSGENG